MPVEQHITDIILTFDGVDLDAQVYDDLLFTSVESRLDMPARAIMEFADDGLEYVDHAGFQIGKAIKIRMEPEDSDSHVVVFEGEVTAIEPNFDAATQATLRIEATTKAHRFYAGTKSQSWTNVTDADVFKRIASDCSLRSDIDETPETFEHISQAAQTNWDFVRERARRIGYLAFVAGDTLMVKKPDYSVGSAVELKWGKNLLKFMPRATGAVQPASIETDYWDMKAKQVGVGTNSGTTAGPSVGLRSSGWPGTFGRQATHLVRWPAVSQNDAAQVAEGARTALWSGAIQAEGVCHGDPALAAGVKVNVSNVGTKFSGSYVLSQVRHVRDEDGYTTEFEVRGLRSEAFSDLVSGGVAADGFSEGSRWYGVVPGVVSDTNDPEGLGRVKVALPWLDANYVGHWARIAVPMAGGASRGVWFAPEVGDEVLLAFEHGDINVPYVVGFLWNGTDNPPSTAVVGGEVEERMIITTSGHRLVFRDKGGSEAIEIIDKTGKNLITIDSGSGLIKVEGKDIEVTATNNIKLKGTNVEVTADANFKVNASANVEITASAQMSLKASAQLSAEASGQVAVKGATINLN